MYWLEYLSEYQVNPQKAGFVEEVGSSITCSPPITPFASTVLWFKNVSSDGTAEVAVGANVNKTLVRTVSQILITLINPHFLWVVLSAA